MLLIGEADDNGNSAVSPAEAEGESSSGESVCGQAAQTSPSTDDERTPNNNTQRVPPAPPVPTTQHPQWSITLEQFLASALTGESKLTI